MAKKGKTKTALKGKTRRKLSKQLRKLVKRHGRHVALGMVTALLAGIAVDRTAKTKSRRVRVEPKRIEPEPISQSPIPSPRSAE